MKKALILIGSLLFILIGLALIYIAPSFSEPKFIINNNTQHVIEITAEWRSNKKVLGTLQAGKSIEFNVRDEADMKITAKFPNRKEISNQPVYFTSGIAYTFEIKENGINSTLK